MSALVAANGASIEQWWNTERLRPMDQIRNIQGRFCRPIPIFKRTPLWEGYITARENSLIVKRFMVS